MRTKKITSSDQLVSMISFQKSMIDLSKIFGISKVLTASEYQAAGRGNGQDAKLISESRNLIIISLGSIIFIVIFLSSFLIFAIVRFLRKSHTTQSDLECETTMAHIALNVSDSEDESEHMEMDEFDCAMKSLLIPNSLFANQTSEIDFFASSDEIFSMQSFRRASKWE
jgi:hypothetical protein